MAVLTCPDCGGLVSDVAPSCIHCGRPMRLDAGIARSAHGSDQGGGSDASAGSGADAKAADFPFFPVSTGKFVAMSVCTFGIYQIYWCYKNWQRIRARSGEKLSPFWRALFAPLWCFSLFGRVRDYQVSNGSSVTWGAGVLGSLYLMLSISWRLLDPWWLVSVGTFMPFIPVLHTTQEVNSSASASESPNESLTGGNIVVLVLGGLLVLLAVVGTFLPARDLADKLVG